MKFDKLNLFLKLQSIFKWTILSQFNMKIRKKIYKSKSKKQINNIQKVYFSENNYKICIKCKSIEHNKNIP